MINLTPSARLGRVPTPFEDHTARAGREEVLCARWLRKSFGGNTVLSDVSLSLQRGEVVLLRGDNGSGKTTLLNILTGNLRPDEGVIHIRTFRCDQTFQFGVSSKNLRGNGFNPERLAQCGIGRSWQDTRLFATQNLRDNISVAKPGQLGEQPWYAVTRPWSVWRQEAAIREEAGAILSRLGLGDRARSSADKISVGQGKRVAIARAVNAGAEVLLLDEPLAGLDASGIEEVLALISELIHRNSLTVVIVEHVFNIPRVLELATTVWTLSEGRLQRESASALRARCGDAVGPTSTGSAYWVNQLATGRMVQSRQLGAGATLTVLSSPASSAEEVLAIRNLTVRRGRRQIISSTGTTGGEEGLSLTLRRGDIGIIGSPNGWGKTTLLEAIAGLLPVHKGEITLFKEPISHLPVWERVSRGLALCRSRSQGFPELTVRETLRLSEVGETPPSIYPLLDRRVAQLSGGERQKVALTCVLNRELRAPLLLLDEPFSALDPEGVRVVCDALITNQNGAILIAIPANSEEAST